MLRRLDWRLVAIAVAILIIAFCTWHWADWQRRAGIAAGFGARIGCSCRLVEGRDIGSCRTDFTRLDGMGWVRIANAADGRGVEASVPLLARRSARIVPGFGCVIDNR